MLNYSIFIISDRQSNIDILRKKLIGWYRAYKEGDENELELAYTNLIRYILQIVTPIIQKRLAKLNKIEDFETIIDYAKGWIGNVLMQEKLIKWLMNTEDLLSHIYTHINRKINQYYGISVKTPVEVSISPTDLRSTDSEEEIEEMAIGIPDTTFESGMELADFASKFPVDVEKILIDNGLNENDASLLISVADTYYGDYGSFEDITSLQTIFKKALDALYPEKSQYNDKAAKELAEAYNEKWKQMK